MGIKVLWAIKGLGPGGAENLLVNQARVRDRDDFEVSTVYELPQKSHLVEGLTATGVPVHLVTGGTLGSLRDLRRQMASVDVVHVHSPLLASKVRLLRWTMRQPPRLVSTEHNSWDAFRWPTRLLNALTSGLDDSRVAVSEAARASMWPHLRPRTEVINHGVDLQPLRDLASRRDAIRSSLGIDPETFLAVTVANLRVHKDYPNLLRAARKVADRLGPRFHLIAVGQGPLEEEVRALHRELGLGDVVTLAGFREDAREIIAAADLFVMASRQEGRPVALMEALVMGRPVVVTDAGGMGEMVRNDVEGRVVTIEDDEALARAMVDVATDGPLRVRYGQASATAGGEYDVRHVEHRLEQIYREIATRRPAGGGVRS